jgi:hypothetical protein
MILQDIKHGQMVKKNFEFGRFRGNYKSPGFIALPQDSEYYPYINIFAVCGATETRGKAFLKGYLCASVSLWRRKSIWTFQRAFSIQLSLRASVNNGDPMSAERRHEQMCKGY